MYLDVIKIYQNWLNFIKQTGEVFEAIGLIGKLINLFIIPFKYAAKWLMFVNEQAVFRVMS